MMRTILSTSRMQSPSVREVTEEHARVSLLDLDNSVVSNRQTHARPRKQTYSKACFIPL